MSFITMKCKNCGSNMSLNPDSKTATCKHCGSTFLLSEILDEKDFDFTKKNAPEDLEKKMLASDAIKQGETYLFKAEYDKAEASFKKAIEYDNRNYKGYLGVVKAKTSNLNQIPDTDDYLEYAKYALDLVSIEDKPYLKSELAKIDILRQQKLEDKRQKLKREKEREKQIKYKKENNRFFGKLAIILVVLFIAIIATCVYFTNKNNPKNKTFGKEIEISTKTDYLNLYSSFDTLTATIILKNDIDFENQSISPLGSVSKPFSGTLNGNGHTIKNATITATDASVSNSFGIIGYASGAYIKNLILDNVNISQNNQENHRIVNNTYGLIVGTAVNTQIEKCGINNNCSINVAETYNCTYKIGGIAGSLSSSSAIENCYSNAEIETSFSSTFSNNTKEYYLGGIAGYVYNSMITYSYSNSGMTSNITSTNPYKVTLYAGGIVGFANPNHSVSKGLVQKCFFDGEINSSISVPSPANNKDEYISGIAGYGANKNVDAYNFATYQSLQYTSNGTNISNADLEDYSLTGNFSTYCSPSTYAGKLNEYLSESNWNFESSNSAVNPVLKF